MSRISLAPARGSLGGMRAVARLHTPQGRDQPSRAWSGSRQMTFWNENMKRFSDLAINSENLIVDILTVDWIAAPVAAVRAARKNLLEFLWSLRTIGLPGSRKWR